MHADFSVELGHDDPVLEIPWASGDQSVRYYDLKTSPELVWQIPEAAAHPEIRTFLTRINVHGSPFATAKCDVWESREIAPEEEIFGTDHKFVSYIDLIFVDDTARSSFEKHEEFAKNLCLLLGRAPDIAATVELVIRRCYYHQQRTDGQDESDRMSKDAQKATPEQKAAPEQEATPLGQETSASYDSEQDPTKQPHGRADHLEPVSRVDASDGQGSEASFNPSSPQDLEAAFKPESPQDSKAPLNLQNPTSFSRHSPSGMGHLHVANIFSSDPKTFTNESTAPRNDRNEAIAGFSLTAYVTGFGDGDHDSRHRWAIAISLLQHALM